MVGDRLSTDIAFGLNNGVLSILVLTGEATLADVEHGSIKPDIILNHASELADYFKVRDFMAIQYERIKKTIAALAAYGTLPQGGTTRLSYTAEYLAAQAFCSGKCWSRACWQR